MSKKDEIAALKAELADVKALLGFSLGAPAPAGGPPPDYIEFGSDGHAAFLGLIKVQEGDDLTGYTTFTSPDSGQMYRLADELQAVSLYPGIDPDKAIVLLLRAKISTFESGPPQVPDDAPPLQLMDVDQWT